jgi:hypothetical protein
MFHFSAPGLRLAEESPAAEWGNFSVYVEVGDDHHAVREVLLFRKNHVLRYDRLHWADEYAAMSRHRFSQKAKWRVYFPNAELIAATEFEKIWRFALKSPIWRLQLANSRMHEWGAFDPS